MASSLAAATRVENRWVKTSKSEALGGGGGNAADKKAGSEGDGDGEAVGLRDRGTAPGLRRARRKANTNISAASDAVTKPSTASATKDPSCMSTQT